MIIYIKLVRIAKTKAVLIEANKCVSKKFYDLIKVTNAFSIFSIFPRIFLSIHI